MFWASSVPIIMSYLLYTDSAWKRSHNLHETYQLPNVQQITPDDGHRRCPKHVEFYDKIKIWIFDASSWLFYTVIIYVSGESALYSQQNRNQAVNNQIFQHCKYQPTSYYVGLYVSTLLGPHEAIIIHIIIQTTNYVLHICY
jgi:hypothetical protein